MLQRDTAPARRRSFLHVKLLKVTVDGFRRFAEPTSFVVNGKLTAIVGPNEAGKTSLLDALKYLNDGDAPIANSDLTRGTERQPTVRAVFEGSVTRGSASQR